MASSKYPAFPVLIVDDEPQAIEGFELTLQSGGINNISTCQDSRAVIPLLSRQEMAVILLDLCMPHVSGQDLLQEILKRYSDTPVIIVTGLNEVGAAVQCMKTGAFGYLVKPVEETRLILEVRHAIDLREERAEYRAFKKRVLGDHLDHPEAFSEIVTRDRTMRSIFQYVETIASNNKPVLITGETGAGKDLLAKAIHGVSRREGPFVAVSVSGLDDNMFSDALFGHLKGAFTGAEERREGLVEQAAGGTLFLDEIGSLSPASQLKLLRLLQEGEYFPVGADAPREATARIVAATNENVQALLERGLFRTDLYYRLLTHHIHLPPLRERPADLPLLLDHFLEQSSQELEKEKPTPPRELIAHLSSYDFPGNIRELQSMVFDAVSRHKSKMLSMDAFKDRIREGGAEHIVKSTPPEEEISLFSGFERLPTLKEGSRLLMAEAMNRSKGNKEIAAEILGITASGLNKALKRAGL
jgi:DNA-binding NtrC family response regulator